MWAIPSKKHDDVDAAGVLGLLECAIRKSRFKATLEVGKLGRTWGVKIYDVRLRRAKHYCGNHPGPCLRDTGRKHPKRNYLEGKDWIGFNHLVNDVLDKLNASWHVFSSINGRYYCRRSGLRRVAYPISYRFPDHPDWGDGDELCFADYRGKPSPEICNPNDGTPGLPCHTPEAEEALRTEWSIE